MNLTAFQLRLLDCVLPTFDIAIQEIVYAQISLQSKYNMTYQLTIYVLKTLRENKVSCCNMCVIRLHI